MTINLNKLLLETSQGTFIEGLVRNYILQKFTDTNDSNMSSNKGYMLLQFIFMMCLLFIMVILIPHFGYIYLVGTNGRNDSIGIFSIIYILLMVVYFIYAIRTIFTILLFSLTLFMGLFL